MEKIGTQSQKNVLQRLKEKSKEKEREKEREERDREERVRGEV